MVKIYTKGNYLDFEAPIYMDEEKRKQFIKGMKAIFGDRIVIRDVPEDKKVLGNIKRHSKKFKFEDMVLLANGELDQDQISSKLQKSSFAIQMKRGPFLMSLITWAKNKELSKLNEEDVKEFLKEQGYAN